MSSSSNPATIAATTSVTSTSDTSGAAHGRSVDTITLTTKRALASKIRIYRPAVAPSKAPVVFLHGAMGLMDHEPALEILALDRVVIAPIWPGYSDLPGELLIEDMLDFALHGWDLIEVLRSEGILTDDPINLVGHCMGGMIAAEMAVLAPSLVTHLALVNPLGLWIDRHPIPDIFATLPYEFAPLLFHDVANGTGHLIGQTDWNDTKASETFLVANARRLGTAGKILFPIPNRRLSKRLYRLTSPTALLWGSSDRLVPFDPYATHWNEMIPHAQLLPIAEAGHLPNLEQPAATAAALNTFLNS
jgi:pimeloyl-ACP methyl ester carboxylesterase